MLLINRKMLIYLTNIQIIKSILINITKVKVKKKIVSVIETARLSLTNKCF